MSFPILSFMLLVPLAGAIGCLMSGAQAARWIALAATLIDLALGIVLLAVLVGAKLGGVVGALGAIPVASAIQIIVVDLLRARRAGLLPDEPL